MEFKLSSDIGFTTAMGIYLYWMPFVVCFVGYIVRTYVNYLKDIDERRLYLASNSKGYYMPTDRVGTLIGRAIVTVLPVVNLFAALFNVGPGILRRFFNWCGKLFDIPLVPRIEKIAPNKPQPAQ